MTKIGLCCLVFLWFGGFIFLGHTSGFDTNLFIQARARDRDALFEAEQYNILISLVKRKRILDLNREQNELLRPLGLTVKGLEDRDFSSQSLIRLGFTIQEVKGNVMEIERPSQLHLRDLGLPAERLKNAGYSLDQLRANHFRVKEVKECYSVDELKEAGYSAGELRAGGVKVADIFNAGYDVNEMIKGGCSVSLMKEKDIKAHDLYAGGVPLWKLVKTGYTCQEIAQGNPPWEEFYDLKAYSLKDYYESGCPIEVVVGKSGLKVNPDIAYAGYNIVDVRNVGYDAFKCHQAGYDAETILSCFRTKQDYFQFDRVQWDLIGIKADIAHGLGYSREELFERGFASFELYAAGVQTDYSDMTIENAKKVFKGEKAVKGSRHYKEEVKVSAPAAPLQQDPNEPSAPPAPFGSEPSAPTMSGV